MAARNLKPSKFSLDDEPDGLVFSTGQKSYYADALHQLAEHGGVLTFHNPTGSLRNQLRKAANKTGFVIRFAESNGAVYVKIVGEFDPETKKEA